MKTKIGAIMDFYENHPGYFLDNVWLEKRVKIPYPPTGSRVRVKINQHYQQFKWVTCTQRNRLTPINTIQNESSWYSDIGDCLKYYFKMEKKGLTFPPHYCPTEYVYCRIPFAQIKDSVEKKGHLLTRVIEDRSSEDEEEEIDV